MNWPLSRPVINLIAIGPMGFSREFPKCGDWLRLSNLFISCFPVNKPVHRGPRLH